MRAQFFITLANSLEKRVREDPGFALPSLVTIAQDHGVSYVTAWKAMRELVRRNIAVALPGKKIAIHPLLRPGSKPSPATSAERLAGTIEQRVTDGNYRFGRRIPKNDYFVATEHCTRSTVLHALRICARKNIIHKERNRWIAGPPHSHSSSGAALRLDEKPVIVVLINDPRNWTSLFQNQFSNQFMSHFAQEIAAHSFQLVPISRESMPDTRFLAIPFGIQDARSTITRLGKRYWGALIWSVDPEIERIESWISMLSSFSQPIVYMDSVDRGEGYTRKSLGMRRYFRLYLDEKGAIETALSAFVRHGHTTIGVHNWTKTDWARRRILKISAVADGMRNRPDIVIGPPAEKDWTIATWASMNEFLASIARKNGLSLFDNQGNISRNRSFMESLRQASGSLIALFRDRGATALLSLSDRLSREYFSWCKALDVRVPDELSIISFDNTPESVFFPVSTIDFGLAHLGYCAAHLFIGDMAIRADANGAIPGRCTLVDRGSVAAPPGESHGHSW